MTLVGTQLDALAQVRVRRVLSLPTTVEITLSGPMATCAPAARLGAALTVSMTGGEAGPVVTDAEVAAITEHHDASGVVVTRIVAQDPLARLRARCSQRTLTDRTVQDHATEMLAEVGLSLVAEADLGPALRHHYQGGTNDLDHLRGLLAQVGTYLSVEERTARAVTLSPSSEVVTLRLGEDLMDLTRGVTASAAPVHVVASGWDLQRAGPLTADVSASAGDLPWVDLRAAGVAPGPAADRDLPGTHSLLLDHQAADLAALTAAAGAALLRGRARAVPIEASALERPDLVPGTTCEFRGHDDAPIALGVLTLVDHRWSASGLTTRLSTVPPPDPGPATPTTTLVRGTVTDTADPESRGRVQVRLPTHGDALSPWLDVLVPGGDAERGLVAVPKAGATVAVLLPDGDLGRALVLGSVLGADGPVVDVLRHGEVTRQVWHSSRHQFVALDDAAGAVHLRNRRGSSLRLGGETLVLHAAGDMVLEAPGRTLRIRAAAVEFEEAPA